MPIRITSGVYSVELEDLILDPLPYESAAYGILALHLPEDNLREHGVQITAVCPPQPIPADVVKVFMIHHEWGDRYAVVAPDEAAAWEVVKQRVLSGYRIKNQLSYTQEQVLWAREKPRWFLRETIDASQPSMTKVYEAT